MKEEQQNLSTREEGRGLKDRKVNSKNVTKRNTARFR